MYRSVPVAVDPADLDSRPLGFEATTGLSPQERAVYEILCEHRGRVLSRHEIARMAGFADCSVRRCDAVILGIRRSLGDASVRTVRRRGWIIDR